MSTKNDLQSRIFAIKQRAEQYRAQAAEYLQWAVELDNLYRWARRQDGTKWVNKRAGTRWVNVTEVELQIGKKYIIRRVFLSPSLVEMPAAVCEWTTGGWKELFGETYPTTMHAATMQVWV